MLWPAIHLQQGSSFVNQRRLCSLPIWAVFPPHSISLYYSKSKGKKFGVYKALMKTAVRSLEIIGDCPIYHCKVRGWGRHKCDNMTQ